MTMSRARWLGLVWFAAAVPALAAQPLTVPANETVYSQPMAVIDGHGAVPFHVTLGMLVNRAGGPVGLYRSYPSASKTPLAEEWGLGMLATRAGVVLASEGGTAILVLHGKIGPAAGVYPLALTYLTGTVPRRYASCILRVAQVAPGQWRTVDKAGHRIAAFTVVSGRGGIHNITNCGS